MKIETAVVPVAGLGTRLLPITAAVPKELLPLGDRPALHLIGEELARAGIKKMILVSSTDKRQIADYFKPNKRLEDRLLADGKQVFAEQLWSHSLGSQIEIQIAIQDQQLGLGHAILCGQPLAGDGPIAVALGDCVMGLGGKSDVLQEMISVFESKSADIVIAFEPVPDEKVSRYGIASPENEPHDGGFFRLKDVIEKPTLAEAPSNLAVAARYVFSPDIFKTLETVKPGKQNEIQLTDAIRQMIRDGARAYGVRLEANQRYDVGNIQSYVNAFIRFALADQNLQACAQAAFESHRSNH